MVRSVFRFSLALLLGNLLGYGFFRLAGWASAFAWQPGPADIATGNLMLRIGLTAVAFGAPPVVVGALAGRLANRSEAMAGLGSALWGLSAKGWWPQQVPFLPPESWVAPATLILLSGLVGGWLVSLRRLAPVPIAPGSATSNNSKP